jgi:hypothetical protein
VVTFLRSQLAGHAPQTVQELKALAGSDLSVVQRIRVARAAIARVRRVLKPGMVETSGLRAGLMFLGGWGMPTVVMVVLLALLWSVDRRLTAKSDRSCP